jgi:hypothetical protein
MDPDRAPPAIIAAELSCPFCHAQWTADNVQIFDLDAGDHCDSGRFYSESCTVSIECHACKREMYRKEGARID